MYWLVRQTSFRHIFDIVFAIWRVKVTTLCNFAIQFRLFFRVCEFAVSINDASILYNYISTILHTLEILRKLVPAIASVLHFNYLTKNFDQFLSNLCFLQVWTAIFYGITNEIRWNQPGTICMYWEKEKTSFRHIFGIIFAIWHVKVTILYSFAPFQLFFF